MKISISFTPAVGRMAPYLAATFLLLALITLAVLLALIVNAGQARSERLELEAQLARYRNRELPSPPKLMPDDKLAVLRDRIRTLNSLTGTKGSALPVMLANLEKLIPDGVWLSNFQYRPREGETKLLVEADHMEFLTDFMDRLEHSGLFNQVLLTRQSRRTEGSVRTIQFEIQLREQP